ncbi:MAG: hypothetical protein AAB415_02880 [Patescibacteria group bacterium]
MNKNKSLFVTFTALAVVGLLIFLRYQSSSISESLQKSIPLTEIPKALSIVVEENSVFDQSLKLVFFNDQIKGNQEEVIIETLTNNKSGSFHKKLFVDSIIVNNNAYYLLQDNESDQLFLNVYNIDNKEKKILDAIKHNVIDVSASENELALKNIRIFYSAPKDLLLVYLNKFPNLNEDYIKNYFNNLDLEKQKNYATVYVYKESAGVLMYRRDIWTNIGYSKIISGSMGIDDQHETPLSLVGEINFDYPKISFFFPSAAGMTQKNTGRLICYQDPGNTAVNSMPPAEIECDINTPFSCRLKCINPPLAIDNIRWPIKYGDWESQKRQTNSTILSPSELFKLTENRFLVHKSYTFCTNQGILGCVENYDSEVLTIVDNNETKNIYYWDYFSPPYRSVYNDALLSADKKYVIYNISDQSKHPVSLKVYILDLSHTPSKPKLLFDKDVRVLFFEVL